MTSMLLLAGIVRFSVPATGEGQVLPDSLPREAVKDAPCAMVAARGEYEGGSFVLIWKCLKNRGRICPHPHFRLNMILRR